MLDQPAHCFKPCYKWIAFNTKLGAKVVVATTKTLF